MKSPDTTRQKSMEDMPFERNYSFFEFWIKYLRTYMSLALDRPIKNRKDIPILLRILNLNGKGAEVGALWRAFSKIILENNKLATLYLIDHWMAQSKESYNDNSNAPVEINEARYQKVVDDFKVYGNRSKIVRATSEEASGQFQEEVLDFVYIDANHSYEAVTQDIQLWWPKIKPGGIMNGHDYFDGRPYDFGVKSAVDEFASKYSQKIYVIKADWPSWYNIKKN